MKRTDAMLSTVAGQQFAAWRGELGLTQTELGVLFGISKTEVYRKECGGRPITKCQVLAVKALLAGVDPAVIHDRESFRAARESAGLLQREVAEAFGITERNLGRLERGEDAIRPVHLLAMAGILHA